MDRRHFIGALAGVGASALLLDGLAPTRAAAEVVKSSGTDLSGWRTVLGDGVWTGPGQMAPTVADLQTIHHGTHSSLEANIHQRGVMAHNITFDRFTIAEGLGATHRASTWFRVPKIPTTSDWAFNAQTVEIGMFVWDGPGTRSDYGLAIQWVLNPWTSDFGSIRAWRMVDGSPDWVTVGYLEPDTEWHKFDATYRPGSTAKVRIDNKNRFDVEETVTLKDPSWGTTVDARFQVEIVSVWPGSNPSVPSFSADFGDWKWAVVV